LSGNYDRRQMQRRGSVHPQGRAVGRSVFAADQLRRSPGRSGRLRLLTLSASTITAISTVARIRSGSAEIPSASGKPVTIAECGTCAYKGAHTRRDGLDAVDYNKDPQEIMRGLVPASRRQARISPMCLEIFETMGFYSATSTNSLPDAPHCRGRVTTWTSPATGIVKPDLEIGHEPRPQWHWSRKRHSWRRTALCHARWHRPRQPNPPSGCRRSMRSIRARGRGHCCHSGRFVGRRRCLRRIPLFPYRYRRAPVPVQVCSRNGRLGFGVRGALYGRLHRPATS